MGTDKARLVLDGSLLACRTAQVIAAVAHPCVEVGQGITTFRHVPDPEPDGGPLQAIAAGWRQILLAGWRGPVLVVATDLPRLTPRVLEWLAEHPFSGSVIPLQEGRPQHLCARWAPEALDTAVRLAGLGERRISVVWKDLDVFNPDPQLWQEAAGDPLALSDADTPAQWMALVEGAS